MYGAEFILVDPITYQKLRDREKAVVCRVYAAIRGTFEDTISLRTLQQKGRQIDGSIIALTHYKTRWAAMQRQWDELHGTFIFWYCSRCGTPFKDNDRCRKCNITFASDKRDDVVVSSGAPGIPARVLVYFEFKLKHEFLSTPPGT